MLTLSPPNDLIDKMSSWTTQLSVVGDNEKLTETEKRDLMQTIVQAAVDAVTKSFSEVSDAVLTEIRAGGYRATKGNAGLTHVKIAMKHVEIWAAMAKSSVNPGVIMSELLNTIIPLQKAYASIS